VISLKKILPVFLSFLIIGSSFFTKVDKVSAAGLGMLSAPGGSSAAIAYIITGLMVAGGAAVAASDSVIKNEIVPKATLIWNKMDETQKAVWNDAVNQSISAGVKTVVFTAPMIQTLKDKLSDISFMNTSLASQADIRTRYITKYGSISYYRGAYRSINSPSGLVISAGGHIGNQFTAQFGTDGGNKSFTLTLVNSTTWNITGTADSAWVASTLAEKNMVFDTLTPWAFAATVGAVIQAGDTVVPAISYFDDSLNAALDNIGTGIKEVNIPVDDFIAKDSTGNVLTNTDGVLTNADGSTYTGNPTWDFPIPGVKVGTAIPTAANPAIPISDVTTGVNDTPIVSEVVEPIPDPVPEPEKKIDFSKLMPVLTTMKTIFPFSIPWDFYDYFARFNVEPETPIYKMNADKTVVLGGKSIPIKFDWEIDFSTFDVVAKICRWGFIICFDIYMITALRKYTPD
jgi:hypothetical protein